MEKIYLTVKRYGVFSIVTGICVIVAGIVLNWSGFRVLKESSKIMF